MRNIISPATLLAFLLKAFYTHEKKKKKKKKKKVSATHLSTFLGKTNWFFLGVDELVGFCCLNFLQRSLKCTDEVVGTITIPVEALNWSKEILFNWN